ncbi:hypothetical protein CLV59_103417 [Chitinophaga dinghuensis]|uniref:Uncharacterized protein n=1 Tax=Chitinophaga dinghuensis TaxID=1539050 RepID=A0A327W2H6_9BACT|nr:hypothetical protein [Chitinophaga dinghuensis]RAJ83449.1 hypothetical protein CLV59_103417 [Chitinophaga dinghuensis]
MGKYKLSLALFIMFLFGICCWSCVSDQFSKANIRLQNHVKFSGKIIYLNVSSNHAYGIIGISVLTTNKNELVDSAQNFLFPYRLSQEYAEFYGYVPVETKIGFNIELDSDKGIMRIYDGNKLIRETAVAVSFERMNIDFVRKNSKFKFSAPA